jgi:hypothetical protein
MGSDPTNRQNTQTRPTHDQKLGFVLQPAAQVFTEKVLLRASIRDVARGTGMSLAGHDSCLVDAG